MPYLKNPFKYIALIACALLCFTVPLLAQDNPVPTLGDLTDQVNVLFGALVIVGGYITRLIPGFKLIPGVYRVLAFAIVAGIFFSVYGASVWSLLLTYFMSTSMYEIILKPMHPKPTSSR